MNSLFLAIVLMVAVVFSQSACQKKDSLRTAEWRGEGPAPELPAGVAKNSKPMTVSLGDQSKKLDFQSQKIDGVEIEGAYFKKVESSKPEYISFQWLDQIPMSKRGSLFLMKMQKSDWTKTFLKEHPLAGGEKAIGETSIVYRPFSEQPELLFRVLVESHDGAVTALYVSRDFRVRSKEIQGSHMDQVSASVFPEGPLKSELQQVFLKNLTGRTLQSSLLKVSTRADLTAEAEDNQFVYPVEDSRFEQVQVYFYINRSMNWFQKTFGFILPFQLEAETSLGYPDKTNTAFYFDHKIRLGEGDNEVFSKIPLDPTIVTHESIHAVIEAVARLPYEGEGGSLNEGFADYFTTTQFDNPRLGETAYKKAPFKRTVENNWSPADRTGGLYHDSGIISGLFWALQKDLGAAPAQQLAWNTLLRMNPKSNFESFKTEVMDLVSKMDADSQKKADLVLKSRGWTE